MRNIQPTKLFKHQEEGLTFLLKNKGIGALYFDVGTGKTMTALSAYAVLKALNPKLQMLVICPASLIESAWIDDVKKFTHLTYENLRLSQYLIADVLLINYETVISKKFSNTLLKILELHPMCVLDESQKIKSYNAKITKTLLSASKYFSSRVLLSATPAPNTESEYWSQMCFLNPLIFGNNYFKFRNRYMALKREGTYLPLYGLSKQDIVKFMQRGYTFVMNPMQSTEFHNRMKPYCKYVKKRDVLDLPDEIDVHRFVEMTKEQDRFYRELWSELVAEINGQKISLTNALAKLMKARQITGGFAYDSEGTVEFKDNPKIKELEEIIDEIGRRRIIIFCQYRWEINAICKKYKDRSYSLSGDTADPKESIQKFTNSENGILVSHPSSGGVGLSFNSCDYMIFYSLSYSFMEYYQARGRIMRAGKKNNATYIHIIAKDSIDEVIYASLRRKEQSHDLFQRIMK